MFGLFTTGEFTPPIFGWMFPEEVVVVVRPALDPEVDGLDELPTTIFGPLACKESTIGSFDPTISGIEPLVLVVEILLIITDPSKVVFKFNPRRYLL